MKSKIIALLIGILTVMPVTALAAPGKAKGVSFRAPPDENQVQIWTGNGGFISWYYGNHYICKGTSKLPQEAIDNMVLEGWWLSNQGPGGAQTICKQAY